MNWTEQHVMKMFAASNQELSEYKLFAVDMMRYDWQTRYEEKIKEKSK